MPAKSEGVKKFVVVARSSGGKLVAFTTDNLPPKVFKYVGIDKKTNKYFYVKYPPEELPAEKN